MMITERQMNRMWKFCRIVKIDQAQQIRWNLPAMGGICSLLNDQFLNFRFHSYQNASGHYIAESLEYLLCYPGIRK